MTKQKRQFGTWPGSIAAGALSADASLYDVQWAGETLVWEERRAGVRRLMAQTGDDAPRQLTPDAMSVRGGVGYGGGSFTVGDGFAYFAADKGRLYRVRLDGGAPSPITPAFGKAASPRLSPDGGWLLYVHSDEGRDCIAIAPADGTSWPQKFASGTDFVMQPAWSPNGRYAAFIEWDHPQMPWDGTRLILAELRRDDTGRPYIKARQVIAGDENTAIFQPEFSPDGRYLSYISDAGGGFGQIYVYDLADGTHTPITDADAEHGTPAWIQGMRTHGWADGRLIFLRNSGGFFTLHGYDVQAETEHAIPTGDYSHMEQISVAPDGRVALIASSDVTPSRVVTIHPKTAHPRIHSRSSTEHLAADSLARAESIQWRGHDGETVYGLFYAPNNARYTADGAPPLIVAVHGGPTSQKTARYESEAQFFATRGFGVLYVNHRGSTGYGREYMLKLRESWGVYDVQDSVSGAAYLAREGRADREKLVIMGGSAGGYTVLQSLVDMPGFYAAGMCRYGIADQFMLVQDTHKFEERYSESLLGKLPEAADRYRDRSPLFHAEKIADPVLIFQGAEDAVVPPNQSEAIVASLRSRGVPHEYHLYEGEGHGFGKPETIQHYYETMLAFLNKYVIYR